MILKKIIAFAILLFNVTSYSQEINREINSVEIFKIAQKNGKNIDIARININKKGIAKRMGGEKGKVVVSSFTESINKLILNGENIMKIDGDDEYRTGIQDPYNRQHIYISVIYQDDYEKENFVNKTCYRYREIDLPTDQSEYLFYKYFQSADLDVIKRLLK